MHIDRSGGRDEVRVHLRLDLPPFAGQSFTCRFPVCGNPLGKGTTWFSRFFADEAPTDLLCFQLDWHHRMLSEETPTDPKTN